MKTFKSITFGIAAVAALGLSACSSDTSNSDADATTSMAEATSVSVTPMKTTPTSGSSSGLIGSGCAAYAEQVPSGPGSVDGMSKDPVTVAASNNPMLKTLTQALSGQLNPDVNLVETLDNGEFTVFAPTDDAFAKLDPATIDTLKTDSKLLTSILTYHVVPGQAGPDKVAGEHVTVQGAPVTVTGAGDGLKVNDAGLVCGGVKTANATVYMIDTVLMPPAA
ncbi:fasciclin domain-containing protein [Mycolicibacterium confluentis]|uniref:Cell surface glycolipoprotein MPT83 n=1 Tax=Mycolicibacterium confluentis TaxID=28047 RepID=A0A7I7XZ95_9MYCO|nr:fasciclin domain-containing protein [Mycolicibacterium confluentis]MCV7317650.1 fasciclin domain-containing protein [Mycolicibacterium confluentis]ORV28273.1 fasciclin [Mycolicibacterium confluentis]BBZ34301.1 cell surface glycolipoprotein MPT83 [Mycolicibacterium confluentis]